MANAIRFLSLDAVEKANSGHPGMPMGMADVVTILFAEFLRFDPKNPRWEERDRFVLSAGHGSMLLYSILYLAGYEDISIDDIKSFRQLGSKTAGHPEYGLLEGIETTTGPLGQGLANAVGMAISEKMEEARNKNHIPHYTYTVVGDGCLMEGISQEAISIAGHLQLNRLIVLFDDNKVSIDGPTSLTISDNTQDRFKASGWNVKNIDGHNFEEIREALKWAKESNKPVLIACRTIIGYGSPNKGGTEHCHGAALGSEEVRAVREKLDWAYPPFEIPEEVLKNWRSLGKKSNTKRELKELPEGWNEKLLSLKAKFADEKHKISTRKASGLAIEALAEKIPNIISGSADLSGSNNTKPSFFRAISKSDFSGNYIYYGVREHAMCSIMNGLALENKFIPFGGTFLVFSDYCRPAIRMSALMGLKVFFVMTHDSIGLGEDGPTHQPIEHLSSLRAIPNLYVFRPADGVEVAECYEIALNLENAPCLFSLTRQDLPIVRDDAKENLSSKGAYVLSEAVGNREVTIFATGSEVAIALEVQKELMTHEIGARVVSVPCVELFFKQDEKYISDILDDSTFKVAIEAAARQSWDYFIGRDGLFIGMKSFGASAPTKDLYEFFGFSPKSISKAIVNQFFSANK